MLYKSTSFTHFVKDQFDKYCNSSKYNVSTAVILNNANDKVKNLSAELNLNTREYTESQDDYYLNRVYRAWNFGGNTSEADAIIFVNSDMAFAPGWIDPLMDQLNASKGKQIVCSRLVESGKLEVGAGLPNRGWAAPYNLGTHPSNFYEDTWLKVSATNKRTGFGEGGLFMPCLVDRKLFQESGGYPEGNIYSGGVGRHTTGFIQSGDAYYFHRLSKEYNTNHITSFESLVYHMQEGEKDE